MQIDPIKPKLKPPGSKSLALHFDVLLSTSAFKFNLCRYITGSYTVARGCGAAELHVSVNGVAAAASPFAVTVTAAATAAAAESRVSLAAATLAPGAVAVAHIAAADAFGCPRVTGRGLHSSTVQLNLSALYGIGGARRGYVSGVEGV